MPDKPQTTITPAQTGTSDVEKVRKLAQKEGLSVEEFIGVPQHWVNSRGFNAYRWADYKELSDCLDRLAQAIEKAEGRERKRSNAVAARLKDALRALTLDLYLAYRTDPALQVGINLNANWFSHSARYRNARLTYKQFLAAFDGLKALGYVQVDKTGFYNAKAKTGLNTKIRATEKLIELLEGEAHLQDHWIGRAPNTETILLKGANGDLQEYEDTDSTRGMRANLTRINAALERCWIDLEVPDAAFSQLQARIRGAVDRQPIDFGQRTLHRVFNQGSFEKGGRFYGGWWQTVPSEYRTHLTINGKRTVELDYSGLHPRMLYALVGRQLPEEPYDIGIDPRHRKLVKKAFNAIINAGPRGVAQPPDYDPADVGMAWSEFLERVKAKHEAVARYFFSGYGLDLQFRDSSIAERVLLHFVKNGIPCLPIHDSFIMHQGYERELEDVMHQAYRGVMAADVPVKAKLTETANRRTDSEAEPKAVTTDLDELLDGRPEYRGYEERLQRWFSERDGRLGSGSV